PLPLLEPEQGRRPEDRRGFRDPLPEGRRRASLAPRLVRRADDPDEMRIGRVAEQPPPLELVREEPLRVVASRETKGTRRGVERLHHHAPTPRPPTAAPGELRDECERPLLRAEVGEPEG